MFKNIIFFLFLLIAAISSSGQRYNYIHYTTENGLPSNVLYTALQDSTGAILINSESGLIKFNGLNFQLFNTRSGLTGNDIVYSEIDRYGRVWLLPFGANICYYKDGKIHNEFNDSLVKKICAEFVSKEIGFTLDSKGALIVNNNDTNKTRATAFLLKETNFEKVSISSGKFSYCIPFHDNGKYYFFQEEKICLLNEHGALDSFSHEPQYIRHLSFNNGYLHLSKITSGKKDLEKSNLMKFELGHGMKEVTMLESVYSNENLNCYTFNNGKIFYARTNKIIVADSDLKTERIFDEFPENIFISDIFFDKQDNLWVSTRNDGLYLLPSSALSSCSIISNKIIENAKIDKASGDMYYTSNRAVYKTKKDGRIEQLILQNTHSGSKGIDVSTERLVVPSKPYFISAYDIHDGVKRIKKYAHLSGAIKSIVYFNDKIAVGGHVGVCLISEGEGLKKIFYKRVTSLAANKSKGTLLIGAMNGVFEYAKDQLGKPECTKVFLEIQEHIIDLKVGVDGLVWVLTNGKIYCYRNGELIHTISTLENLENYSINCISGTKESCLLIGTNAGLVIYEYKISDKGLAVVRETVRNASNGLIDNFIKDAQWYSDSEILVISNTGMSIFNTKKYQKWDNVHTEIFELLVNGEKREVTKSVRLAHEEQFLRLRFSSLLFGRMKKVYKYRLIGLRNKWARTEGNEIEFGPLAPGDYTFEVVAVDKELNPIGAVNSISISVEPAFWQTAWFKVLLTLLVLGLIVWIVYLWLKRKKQGLQNEREFAELKMHALKAQMNPHFIFNSLNAIQSYINEGAAKANESNRYISKFAKLIRQTLNFATKDYISLKEEIAYLDNYVALEKLRFGNKFSYQLIVDDNIDLESQMVPPMLIQIYAENAIKHGLTHKKGSGHLVIKFTAEKDYLHCIVDDDGVGRKHSAKIKSQSSHLPESKGMNLNLDRLDMYNVILDNKITLNIVDKSDKNGQPLGTTVNLKIPVI